MAPKTVARPASPRGPVDEAARVGPEEHVMSRPGWTTIAIPTDLHARLTKHVPKRARSVQAYITFWAQAGDLIDTALESTSDPQELLAALRSIVSRKSG